jgi:hypothetical protein
MTKATTTPATILGVPVTPTLDHVLDAFAAEGSAANLTSLNLYRYANSPAVKASNDGKPLSQLGCVALSLTPAWRDAPPKGRGLRPMSNGTAGTHLRAGECMHRIGAGLTAADAAEVKFAVEALANAKSVPLSEADKATYLKLIGTAEKGGAGLSGAALLKALKSIAANVRRIRAATYAAKRDAQGNPSSSTRGARTGSNGNGIETGSVLVRLGKVEALLRAIRTQAAGREIGGVKATLTAEESAKIRTITAILEGDGPDDFGSLAQQKITGDQPSAKKAAPSRNGTVALIPPATPVPLERIGAALENDALATVNG